MKCSYCGAELLSDFERKIGACGECALAGELGRAMQGKPFNEERFGPLSDIPDDLPEAAYDPDDFRDQGGRGCEPR